MKLLKSYTHNEVSDIKNKNIFKRTTARGIIIQNEEILLIYTKRYDDYSFPGGGVDAHEDLRQGLLRELAEETGATNVEIVEEFGAIEEFRPVHYPEYDLMHQTSYYYVCKADCNLGQASPEDYELINGSEPVWVNIKEALSHNQNVIANSPQGMGFSIQRETFMLERIVSDLPGNLNQG